MGGCPANWCRLRPGDEIELSRELVVTVSATKHTVPSLGFVVWERRRKLLPEFHGLPGEQIRDLRLAGTDVTSEVRMPRLAYLGDSSPEGLDACEAMYAAEVLIMELTFVAPSHRKDKIHKFGHMHLDDFLDRAGAFPQRVDHRQPLQHPLSCQPDSPARGAGPCPTCSTAVCTCGSESRGPGVMDFAGFRRPLADFAGDMVDSLLRRPGQNPESAGRFRLWCNHAGRANAPFPCPLNLAAFA